MAVEDSRLEKGLAGAVVFCEVWRLAKALYLYFQVVSKSTIQSMPHL